MRIPSIRGASRIKIIGARLSGIIDNNSTRTKPRGIRFILRSGHGTSFRQRTTGFPGVLAASQKEPSRTVGSGSFIRVPVVIYGSTRSARRHFRGNFQILRAFHSHAAQRTFRRVLSSLATSPRKSFRVSRPRLIKNPRGTARRNAKTREHWRRAQR